jgi:hypothetical protein
LFVQVPRHRRALALSQDVQAVGVLAGVALVRGAVMRVVAQLPPTALSSRAIGLLAYGCTRSWGVDRSAQEKKAVKLAVRSLAHAAASRAFAPPGPGDVTGSGVCKTYNIYIYIYTYIYTYIYIYIYILFIYIYIFTHTHTHTHTHTFIL